MKWLCFLVLLIHASLAAPAPDTLPLNEKVIAFCKAQLGTTVGNGECAELAGHALKAAGAKLRAGPDFPDKGDYVWGKQVFLIEATPAGPKATSSFGDIRAGDILQFRDVRFGSTGGFHHHTAVVAEVNLSAEKIVTYQQNIGGKRFVIEGHPNLKHLEEGWIRFYRPIAK